jgi:hypothetical protein
VQLLAGPPTQRAVSLHTRAALVRAKLDALSSAFIDEAIDRHSCGSARRRTETSWPGSRHS